MIAPSHILQKQKSHIGLAALNHEQILAHILCHKTIGKTYLKLTQAPSNIYLYFYSTIH